MAKAEQPSSEGAYFGAKVRALRRREGATPAYGSKSSQPFTSVVALNGD